MSSPAAHNPAPALINIFPLPARSLSHPLFSPLTPKLLFTISTICSYLAFLPSNSKFVPLICIQQLLTKETKRKSLLRKCRSNATAAPSLRKSAIAIVVTLWQSSCVSMAASRSSSKSNASMESMMNLPCQHSSQHRAQRFSLEPRANRLVPICRANIAIVCFASHIESTSTCY